jgi:alkylation response protein AidB-like acyl-CoA dehydrogenase
MSGICAGRVVIITGAGRGPDRAHALAFAREGAIQVLGGIGFTCEHPAQRYFRRARTSAVLFGTEAQHRATLANRLGL